MKTDLALKIDQSTAHRKSREQLSNYVLRHLDEIEDFIQIAFDPSHKNHVKAFWSLELVCEKKLKVFVPFIDMFCEVLPLLKEDSSIRPATKICLFLAKSNHRKNGISLTQEQEHLLLEALLDRLIQNEKVRQVLNEKMVGLATNFSEQYSDKIIRYISERIHEWDSREMIAKIESEVGGDLHMIRVNGVIVGAFIGLALGVIRAIVENVL